MFRLPTWRMSQGSIGGKINLLLVQLPFHYLVVLTLTYVNEHGIFCSQNSKQVHFKSHHKISRNNDLNKQTNKQTNNLINGIRVKTVTLIYTVNRKLISIPDSR